MTARARARRWVAQPETISPDGAASPHATVGSRPGTERRRGHAYDPPDSLGHLTITRCLQAALDRAELPHTRFHDLHHSAATFHLSQGFGLEDVKNLPGHSTIVPTSNTYGHVLEQRQQEMARGMDAVLGG